MKYYSLPCNPDVYNIKAAFENLDLIDWPNSPHMHMDVGSIVLIYESKSKHSAPNTTTGRIRYIAQIVDSNVSEAEKLNNDLELFINPKLESRTTAFYIRMKPLMILPDEISSQLTKAELDKNNILSSGVHKFNIIAKQQIKSPLKEYIQSVLKPLDLEQFFS